MLICHTIYAYMYKKMKHYKNDLEFHWGYKGFKNIFWFYKVKIDIYIINA